MIRRFIKELNINQLDIRIDKSTIKYIIKKVNEHEENMMKKEHKGVRSLESAIKHILERIKILIDSINTPIEKLSYNIKNFTIPHQLTNEDVDILLKNFMAKDEMPASYKHMFM
jgi:hypothetical protein